MPQDQFYQPKFLLVAVNYNKIQLQVLMCMISLGLQMAVTWNSYQLPVPCMKKTNIFTNI